MRITIEVHGNPNDSYQAMRELQAAINGHEPLTSMGLKVMGCTVSYEDGELDQDRANDKDQGNLR